jgi:hypothetical protein
MKVGVGWLRRVGDGLVLLSEHVWGWAGLGWRVGSGEVSGENKQIL